MLTWQKINCAQVEPQAPLPELPVCKWQAVTYSIRWSIHIYPYAFLCCPKQVNDVFENIFFKIEIIIAVKLKICAISWV